MKQFILIFLIVVFYIFIGDIFTEKVIIPKESIRLRVVANSDDEIDQSIKKEVSKAVQSTLTSLLKNTNNIDSVRKIINSNIDKINATVRQKLGNDNYNIVFGDNYFPQKNYKGVIYEEGYYESLLVTLGQGLGENWWCVLFPPLCLMEAEQADNVEYTTMIKEILNKYF